MNPLWSKAPLLLMLRYRKVLVATIGSAALLGLTSVAGPAFLSSSGSAAIADQVGNQPPLTAGFRIGRFGSLATPEARESLVRDQELLAASIGGRPHVGPPVTTMLGPDRELRSAAGSTPVRLIYRSGSPDHVEIVAGDGSEVLVADTVAEELGASVGDRLTIGGGSTVEVSGIYRALATAPGDEYWANLRGLIFPDPTGATPPPFLILDQDRFFDVAGELDLQGNSFWEFPLERDGLTLSAATSLAGYMQTMARAVNDNETIGDESIQAVRGSFAASGAVTNTLPGLVRNAQGSVTALEGPVLVLSLAGSLLAIAVMAAAGAYVVASRRTEAQLLIARGMSPALQGLRSTLEATIPAVAGASVGAILGIVLVRAVGPSELIATDEATRAFFRAGGTLIVGLFSLGMASALAVRNEATTHQPRRERLMKFPWELPVMILAGAAFYEITTRDSAIIEGPDGDRIDIFVLLFPVLFLAGSAGIVARLLRGGLKKLRSLSDRGSPAMYLAARRLAAAPGSILGLLIASILAVGILIYAQSLAQTIQTSTEAKAGVFVGSDLQLLVYPTTEVPDDFPLPATRVRKVPHLSMTNGVGFTMLGVDGSTFERAAFWDESFANSSLAELLDDIEPTPGEPLPVIVAGGEGRIESQPSIDLSSDIAVDAVAFVRAFPGLSASEPLVIAEIEAMREMFAGVNSAATANAEDLLWVKGSSQQALRAAAEAGISFGTVTSATQVLARPTLASVTWAFDLLRALGIAAGVIALAAMLLYIQGRQRSTVVAYAMARRMGLRRRTHAASLALELGALLTVAILAGAILASTVARLVFKHLDLLPQIPPDPLLRVPGTVVLSILALGIVAAIAGALSVQRGADRARVAEVLRLAE